MTITLWMVRIYVIVGAIFGLTGFVLYFHDWRGSIDGKIFYGISRAFLFFVFWPLLFALIVVILSMIAVGWCSRKLSKSHER
jgi:hypothetical protein